MKENYFVDERGFYGEFGGAYVPEILYKCVHDLQEAYLPIIESPQFKEAYHAPHGCPQDQQHHRTDPIG